MFCPKLACILNLIRTWFDLESAQDCNICVTHRDGSNKRRQINYVDHVLLNVHPGILVHVHVNNDSFLYISWTVLPLYMYTVSIPVSYMYKTLYKNFVYIFYASFLIYPMKNTVSVEIEIYWSNKLWPNPNM